MFENLIYETIGKFDLGMPILVENESRLIGNCYIPDSLWNNFNTSNILVIEVDKNTRIKRLVHEYSHFEVSILIEKTSQLRKRLGGQHLNEAISALENKDFEYWIDKLLVYYDKTYDYSRENNKERIKSIPFNWSNFENDLLNIEKTINHEFKK
jgi:tRNA 2-selenouridine synthase